MKFTNFQLLMLVLNMFLTGCVPPAQSLDAGLITRQPCAAPCWQNLTPGKSTDAEVERFLNGLGSSWEITFPMNKTKKCWGYIAKSTLPKSPSRQGSFWIDFSDGILYNINSFPGGNNTPLLPQITSQFGEPEYYSYISVEAPEGKINVVKLYYPHKGVILEMARDDVIGQIRPDMAIIEYQYWLPGDLLEFISRLYSCGSGTQSDNVAAARVEISRSIRPWKSFGEVEYLTSKY